MSAAQPPTNEPNSDVISLEDIDNLLASEDPEFAKSMAEVQAVESDTTATIDASTSDESLGDGEKVDAPQKNWRSKLKSRITQGWQRLRARLIARLVRFGQDALIFLKTRPKEFLFYSIAMSKTLARRSVIPVMAFRGATRWQRITVLLLIAFSLGSLWVLLANFKGIWLPQINEPILQNLAPHADSVTTYNPKTAGESFYSAFPQERYEFLFQKMKTNLRRTSGNANPMGAFEIIVVLDSKDTAIEVRDRQIEFFDLLQRAFEGESFNDLESELGKARLKSKIKKELNSQLTQGWVKDVNFKTFLLKP